MNVGHCHPEHPPQQQSDYSGQHNNTKKHYVINSEQIIVKKATLPSRGVVRIQLRPGGPAHGLFFASKIRCPLTKNIIIFSQTRFLLENFFVGKLWTCSIHFWQNKQLRSSKKKSRAPNMPHGAKIKKISTFPTQFNKKIVRPPKKVRKIKSS